VPVQYGVEQAMAFTPSASGYVSDIWVAMWYVPSDPQPDEVTLRLVLNPDGLPPKPKYVLEEWTISEFEPWDQWNPPIHLEGSGETFIEEGQSYWLWASGGETTWCGWCLNSAGVLCPHTLRREGEDWLPVGNETASAFRVDVLPEGLECPADVAPPGGDGTVDVLDLLAVLAAWGDCPGCPEDINDDGVVDVLDLLEVLGAWGPCPVGEIGALQLAGNELLEYPYVEYVRAFNEGSMIAVAIDPRGVPN